MYLSSGGPSVRRGRLPPGTAGTRVTLDMMRALARKGGQDVAVRERALAILRAAGVAGHDFAGEVRALFSWVRDRVRFVRDPAGVEWLQAPRYTLERGYGDCDDKATALAAMLLAVGHPAALRLRAVGFRSGTLSHVYVLAKLAGRWVPLDPTWAGTPFGEAPPGVRSALEVAV